MRKYLYRKLRDYLALYIRPEDCVVEIDPSPQASGGQMQRLFRLRVPDKTSTIVPNLEALNGLELNYVVLNGTIHYEADVQDFFALLRPILQDSTRVIITFYSSLWKPAPDPFERSFN